MRLRDVIGDCSATRNLRHILRPARVEQFIVGRFLVAEGNPTTHENGYAFGSFGMTISAARRRNDNKRPTEGGDDDAKYRVSPIFNS